MKNSNGVGLSDSAFQNDSTCFECLPYGTSASGAGMAGAVVAAGLGFSADGFAGASAAIAITEIDNAIRNAAFFIGMLVVPVNLPPVEPFGLHEYFILGP